MNPIPIELHYNTDNNHLTITWNNLSRTEHLCEKEKVERLLERYRPMYYEKKERQNCVII